MGTIDLKAPKMNPQTIQAQRILRHSFAHRNLFVRMGKAGAKISDQKQAAYVQKKSNFKAY